MTTTTNPLLIALAHRIDRNLVAHYNEFLDDCARDRAAGYRPQFCEHGMNQWVDYDPICGPCEDGLTMGNPLQRRREALRIAHERMTRFIALRDAVNVLRAERIDIDYRQVVTAANAVLVVPESADALAG